MNNTIVTANGNAANPESRLSQNDAESVECHPQICLLGADYENSNLGIRALTTGALTAIISQYPNAGIQILDYGTDPKNYDFDLPGKTVHVEMLNIRFSKKPWLKNHMARLIVTAILFKLVPSQYLRRKWGNRNPWLKALLDADYVLSINYGDSFSDIYGIRRFFYVSLPQVLALLLNKPVVQLPQTIGPFKSRTCRTVAKWILSRNSLVYTRDEEAVATIRTMVPRSHAGRVRFCHDLGFVVPSKDFDPIDPPLAKVFSKRPVVGFNVSGLLWMGGYTRHNMFNLAVDYKKLVREMIAEFIEAKGAIVLLIPHVVAAGGEGDPSVCNELYHEMQPAYPDRLFMLKLPFDEREVKHVICQCDFFIGARMHACIAALSQCVPTAAMAYSGKFKGVFRSVGMQSSVIDLTNSPADKAVEVLMTIFDSREELKLVLGSHIPEVQQNVISLLKDLRNKV